MLSLLFFPIRLLFGILLLPFLVVRFLLKAIAAVVLLPIVLLLTVLALGVGLLTFSVAVLAPLLPLLIVAGCVWCVARLVFRPSML